MPSKRTRTTRNTVRVMAGKRGRPRKPTEIKIADGTYRKHRDKGRGKEVKQQALEGIPDPPEHLGETGRVKWIEAASWLLQCGILEPRYLHSLLLYGEAWDRKERAENAVREQGEYLTTFTGGMQKHPAMNVIREAFDQIHKLHGQFGFTPSASASIHQIQQTKKTGVSSRQRA